ncbi:MAG: hypothetical protein IT384_03265 [Deltaproteobacteria bacterium]|nr:hypothetical protein [Deltaproteobacteria bacterium]
MKLSTRKVQSVHVPPKEEIARAVKDALAAAEAGDLEGAREALAKVTGADPRIARLQATLELNRRSKVTPQEVQRAFRNLAEGARCLLESATGTAEVHVSQGASLDAFDRRMMKATVKLAETNLHRDSNTPAACVISLDGKVVAIGVNRAYAPLYEWNRHGETEALAAVTQRLYCGMAQVLDLYRKSGGKLDESTGALLDVLIANGVTKDLLFADDAKSLQAGGFFHPDKIALYARDLKSFTSENRFLASIDHQAVDEHNKNRLGEAIQTGTLKKSDLAGWAAYDRIHARKAKLSLYTSLEPCGMCFQNCVSHGQIGRVVFGAYDDTGGAISGLAAGVKPLDNVPVLYRQLGRVPVEIVGGILRKEAQALYEHFQAEIYSRVRQAALSSS